MSWYVNNSQDLDEDWNWKLRQAGFFRTNYTHDALERFLKKLNKNEEKFHVTNKLEEAMPQDVYFELAKAGLLSNTRKINLIKKLIKSKKEDA